MEPLISSVPIMVVEGNHEIELQAENQTFVSYSSRFAFPSEESGSSSTFYYSFNAGGIHFIMLGAYISYNKSGKLSAFCIYHIILHLAATVSSLSSPFFSFGRRPVQVVGERPGFC